VADHRLAVGRRQVRSAQGRRGHRVSRAKPTPTARRPRGIPPQRAASAREDAAP